MAMHNREMDSLRCDVTDEIEAAIMFKQRVSVDLKDGSNKYGLPVAIEQDRENEYLVLEGHVPINISDISAVERDRRIEKRIA